MPLPLKPASSPETSGSSGKPSSVASTQTGETFLQKLLKERPAQTEHIRFLVYGQSGSGKTYSLRTAKKPLFVDSFDPGGSVVLSDLIAKGLAVVRSEFEQEDPKHPSAFEAWDKAFDELEKAKVMDKFGTYVLDSATTWGQACLNYVMKKAGRAGGTPQQNDWYPQMVLMEAGIRRIFALPCDVIFICHDDVQKDEIIGKLTRAPMLTGKSKTRIPLLFSEIYYSDSKRSSKGTEWVWQLQRDNTNQAKSRLCGLAGKALDFVPQNYGALMKELGRPYEDLPPLTLE